MKRSRAKPSYGLLAASLLLLLIAVPGFVFCLKGRLSSRNAAALAAIPVPKPAWETAVGAGHRDGLTLYSAHVLLYDLDNDAVLYAVKPEETCEPASLTKLMTVYAALQKLDDLDASVTVGYSDLAGLYEANASMAGLQEGDAVPLRDLLYATMLPSGADAANTLARAACGSVEDFVAQMNAEALSLGMADTHFTNVTGLPDPAHYTTAADLLTLLKKALQNETFREILCTDAYTTVPTSAYPAGIPLVSTLSQRLAAMGLDRGPLLGGKTGYTEEAGLCLASLACVNGHNYALVTMGAAGDGRSEQTNLLDALNLYSRCK